MSERAQPHAGICTDESDEERQPVSLCQEPAPIAGNSLTQAVDILAFVEAQEIPPDYFETPYYLAPAPGGEQDYALLRETLRRTRKIGIAYVVIQARQHLAALIPHGQSLVLNTLRWNTEEGLLRRGPALQQRPSPAAAPLRMQPCAPLKQMHVTGCDGYEESEGDDIEDNLAEGLIDGDDLRRAFLHPRTHATAPPAGRSTTVRRPHGAARMRRIARRT